MSVGKGNDTIHLEIKIHTPVQEIWKAWTEPGLILQRIGSDPKGEGLKARMDVRTGGKYEISFRGSDGVEHSCFGMYTEVKEFRKLVFSWEWKSEPGVESFVTMDLTPEDDYTLMQFEHSHVGDHSIHNYLTGWAMTFEKLKLILNQK